SAGPYPVVPILRRAGQPLLERLDRVGRGRLARDDEGHVLPRELHRLADQAVEYWEEKALLQDTPAPPAHLAQLTPPDPTRSPLVVQRAPVSVVTAPAPPPDKHRDHPASREELRKGVPPSPRRAASSAGATTYPGATVAAGQGDSQPRLGEKV